MDIELGKEINRDYIKPGDIILFDVASDERDRGNGEFLLLVTSISPSHGEMKAKILSTTSNYIDRNSDLDGRITSWNLHFGRINSIVLISRDNKIE